MLPKWKPTWPMSVLYSADISVPCRFPLTRIPLPSQGLGSKKRCPAPPRIALLTFKEQRDSSSGSCLKTGCAHRRHRERARHEAVHNSRSVLVLRIWTRKRSSAMLSSLLLLEGWNASESKESSVHNLLIH